MRTGDSAGVREDWTACGVPRFRTRHWHSGCQILWPKAQTPKTELSQGGRATDSIGTPALGPHSGSGWHHDGLSAGKLGNTRRRAKSVSGGRRATRTAAAASPDHSGWLAHCDRGSGHRDRDTVIGSSVSNQRRTRNSGTCLMNSESESTNAAVALRLAVPERAPAGRSHRDRVTFVVTPTGKFGQRSDIFFCKIIKRSKHFENTFLNCYSNCKCFRCLTEETNAFRRGFDIAQPPDIAKSIMSDQILQGGSANVHW